MKCLALWNPASTLRSASPAIYQQCRTPQQIQFEFDELQRELEREITAGQRDAREKLLDNFDQEVVEKVRVQSHDYLDRFNDQLWQVTRHELAAYAHFDATGTALRCMRIPYPGEKIHPGPYRMAKGVEDANTYRVGHPLAQRVLGAQEGSTPPPAEVVFRLQRQWQEHCDSRRTRRHRGWMTCSVLADRAGGGGLIVLAGVTDEGAVAR